MSPPYSTPQLQRPAVAPDTPLQRTLREQQILLDSARELALPTAAKPFYDDRAAMQRALLARAVQDGRAPVKLPGFWNLLSHRNEN